MDNNMMDDGSVIGIRITELNSCDGTNTPDSQGDKPALFARYTPAKYAHFQRWLKTKHGVKVYTLFVKFARAWRQAGNDHCGADLIANRIRWEMSVGPHEGFKVKNDFTPMMARQLVLDDPSFQGFFNLQLTPTHTP